MPPWGLGGRLVNDERLRAMCLSGAITYESYVERLVGTSFGTIEVRARRPYRVLDPRRYGVDRAIVLESLDREDLFVTPSTWFYDGGGCC